MLIDWFTVGAQALNFAILVWLLKRFLYKPILNAIDARESRIAAQLADRGFDDLDAPIRRLNGKPSPTPYSPTLEAAVVPDAEAIAEAIRELCAE